MSIEKVKLDDNLKPISNNLPSLIGLLAVCIMLFGYLAIWLQGIYIQIFLTVFWTFTLLYNMVNKK